ncbi:MAG: T9SS type A sorting domain-containing protein [Candidatus Eisenbacteria bacterium]
MVAARRPLSLVALLLILVLTLPAISFGTDPAGGTGGGTIDGSLGVRVVDGSTHSPLPGAFVMVGLYDGFPFPGNWGFTDGAGEIVFAHPELTGPVTVTAGAPGYGYFTIFDVGGDDLVLPLDPISSAGVDFEVGDFVSGIDVNNGSFNIGDGNLDMAVVLPALSMQDMMSFDMGSLFGPPDTIEILGTPFAVPSNMFIPSQYEVFTEIVKDHYALFLEPGDYTLVALSMRVALQDLANAVDIIDLIPALDWRETDLLDITVAGPTASADLFVDPDLVNTVGLTVGNLPENGTAWCISAGDLDGANGNGRLAPLGLGSVSCPGGGGPCGGTVSLTTTAAADDFAGTTFFPAVAFDSDIGEDVLVAMNRSAHGQTYSETIDDFFLPLDLFYDNGVFSWSDAENPLSGSPAVDLQTARLENAAGDSVFWKFLLPGDRLSMLVPWLPLSAPPGPGEGGAYAWRHASIALGFDLASFDFDAFAFSDIVAHASHLALDGGSVSFGSIATGVDDEPAPARFGLRENAPNPFNPSTTVRFDLAVESTVDLSVYSAAGRRVATLLQGPLGAGVHEAVWTGADDGDRQAPSGVYFARLEVNGRVETRKITLLR